MKRVAFYFEFYDDEDPQLVEDFKFDLMARFEVYENLAISHECESHISLLTQLDNYVPHSLRKKMKAFVILTVEESRYFKRG